MPTQAHIQDDDLEAYSMKKPQLGIVAADIEEHVLICEHCRMRLDDMDAYVKTMKASLRLIEARERARLPED